MKEAATSREAVLEAAYRLAEAGGLGAVNVRAVAAGCGVAVGTVYHYYPSKAALCSEVASEFWCRAVHGAGDWQQGGCFADACAHLAQVLREHLGRFEADFVRALETGDAAERQAGKALEARYFGHIQAGLLAVLARDPRVDPALWTDDFSPEDAVRFFWAAILGAARAGAPSGLIGRAAARMLYQKEES